VLIPTIRTTARHPLPKPVLDYPFTLTKISLNRNTSVTRGIETKNYQPGRCGKSCRSTIDLILSTPGLDRLRGGKLMKTWPQRSFSVGAARRERHSWKTKAASLVEHLTEADAASFGVSMVEKDLLSNSSRTNY
jgi:hypothetical protein